MRTVPSTSWSRPGHCSASHVIVPFFGHVVSDISRGPVIPPVFENLSKPEIDAGGDLTKLHLGTVADLSKVMVRKSLAAMAMARRPLASTLWPPRPGSCRMRARASLRGSRAYARVKKFRVDSLLMPAAESVFAARYAPARARPWGGLPTDRNRQAAG
jgi:hypothetical protein